MPQLGCRSQRGLAGFAGSPAGSGAASETCWRAEATASMQSSSLGVATTSSDVGAGCAASLEAMEAEDSAPGSMSSASQ